MSEIKMERIVPNLVFFTYNDSLLGLDRLGRGIYSIDTENRRVWLKGLIPDVIDKMPFSNVKVWGDKLVFVPFRHTSLNIYDTKNHDWDCIVLFDNPDKALKGLFLDAVMYEGHLILLPFNFDKVVDIDLGEKLVTEIDIHSVCGSRTGDRVIVKYLWRPDGRILAPLFATNTIIEYDVKNRKIAKHELSDNKFQINTIVENSKNVYLLSRNSLELIVLDKELVEIDRIRLADDISPLGDDITYFDQSGFECYGSNLFCFAARWDRCMRIDLNDYSYEVVEPLNRYCETIGSSENISKFNHGIVVDSKIYIQNHDEKIVEFDMETVSCNVIETVNNDPNGENLKDYIRTIISD